MAYIKVMLGSRRRHHKGGETVSTGMKKLELRVVVRVAT